jgi:hypothetical protein
LGQAFSFSVHAPEDVLLFLLWKYMTRLELIWLPKVTVYAIGSTASFWVIERTMSF